MPKTPNMITDCSCDKDEPKIAKNCKAKKTPAKKTVVSDLKKPKPPNPWIVHLKKYAADNNLSYSEALRDPKSKIAFEKGKAKAAKK